MEQAKPKLIITRRSDDYHATLDRYPEVWGFGETPAEAVGSLVFGNTEHFGLGRTSFPELKLDPGISREPVRESTKPELVITRRSDDYHAALSGHRGVWGCGKSIAKAIGSLVLAHVECFGLGPTVFPPREQK